MKFHSSESKLGRGNYLTLLPGVGYWDKHEFKLNDFFNRVGTYSISTSLLYRIGVQIVHLRDQTT
jgi:hypothetical protein